MGMPPVDPASDVRGMKRPTGDTRPTCGRDVARFAQILSHSPIVLKRHVRELRMNYASAIEACGTDTAAAPKAGTQEFAESRRVAVGRLQEGGRPRFGCLFDP